MKSFLLSIALLMMAFQWASAQIYVGDSRSHVINNMRFSTRKYKKTSSSNTSDSSYTFLIRGTVQPVDFYFLFDKKDRCSFEKVSFNCDSCFRKMIGKILETRKYEWTSIGNNQYMSKYSKQWLLTKDTSAFTFTVKKLNYTRDEYNALKKEKAAKSGSSN